MRDFVFLTSASFSGSTLLTFLLNTHPSIATIGEMKGDSMDLEQYACSCGSPIGKCSFWGRVVENMRERGFGFDLADVATQCGFKLPNDHFANKVVRHRVRSLPLEVAREAFIGLAPACRRAFPEIRRRNAAFVETVCELSGKPIFLDASKDPIRLKYLRRIPEFRIKVLSIVRDGRGVMNSMMKRHTLSPEEAVREWVVAQEEIATALNWFDPSQVLSIRYEDLCLDPDGVLGRVFEFLGVSPSEAVRDFRSVEHHILGNPMRFQNSSEIVLDTKWKTMLTPEHLQVFDRVGGALNRRLAYDKNEAAPPVTAGAGV